MKKMYKIALLSIFVFAVFAVSFTAIPPKTNVKTDNVSLEGYEWTLSTESYHCYLRFISDRTVVYGGYYYQNGEGGYGAWESSLTYYYDGQRGQIWNGDRNDNSKRMVGSFRYKKVKSGFSGSAGNPLTLNMNSDWDPFDGELILRR